MKSIYYARHANFVCTLLFLRKLGRIVKASHRHATSRIAHGEDVFHTPDSEWIYAVETRLASPRDVVLRMNALRSSTIGLTLQARDAE